jgi:hypothetical protein
MTFWTQKKLKELRKASRTKNLTQLAVHFSKTQTEITNALRFDEQLRKLKIGTRTERIQDKIVKITMYAAAYAENSRVPNFVQARNNWF